MSKESGENLAFTSDVKSSLRDRIAAALRTAPPLSDDLTLADAVIAELGLQPPGLQPDGSFIDATGVVWRHTGKDWTNDQTYRP
jgi:hypothetical protein